MLETGDILYHSIYGFGIVKKIDNAVTTIAFCDGLEKKIVTNHPSITRVNEKLINEISQKGVEDFFDDWTIKKAKDYTQAINVYDCKENSISAYVSGNRTYSTTVRLENDRLMFSCNCPVDGLCKHEAALYYNLKRRFETLPKTQRKIPIKRELLQCINHIKDYGITLPDLTKLFDLILEDPKLGTIVSLIEEFEPEPYSYRRRADTRQIRDLIGFLLLNDKIRKIVNDNLSSFVSSNHYRTIVQSLKYVDVLERNQDDSNIVRYHFANRRYKECIISSFDYGEFRNREFVLASCEKAKPDEELIEALKTRLNRNPDVSIYKPLIMNMPFDHILDMVKDRKCTIYYEDLTRFTNEQIIGLLPYARLDNNEIYRVLNSGLLSNADDTVKAMIASGVDKEDLDSRQKANLLSTIRSIGNSRYLQEYIENSTYRHGRYYWFDRGYFHPFDMNEEYDIDDNAFFAYFREDYEVERNDDDVELHCYLKLMNDKTIVDAVLSKTGYMVTTNDFDGLDESVYVRYLISHIINKHKESIQKKREEILSIIKQEKDIEKSNNALYSLNRIAKEETGAIRLVDNKAHLEYYFDTDEDDRYLLSFKVGINKAYVVKNVYQFFESFTDCGNVEYGKNFSLTHDVENFNDTDARIIGELLKTVIYSENKKDLILTPSMFDYLVEELKNKTIYFRKKAYKARLDNRELAFGIDNEHRIQLTENQEYGRYLYTDRNIYLLDEKEGYMDRVCSTYRDAKIMKFLLQNIDTCVKPLLEEFKETVYYDHRDIFTLDEGVRQDFHINDIDIKAYFDYEESIITCRSEYYIDDKKVAIDHIKEKHNITKLNRYHDYLSGLGFENDTLENDGKILNFFYMDFSELKKYCEVHLSDSIQNKKVSRFAPAKIQITRQGNIMEAFVKESEYSDEELYKILSAIKKKKKYIVMKDDRIIDLTNSEAKEFSDVVDELDLNKKSLTESTSLPIAKALKAMAHQNSCNIDDYLLNMISDISNFKKADIRLPNVNATLRDYQKEGFNWLSILSRYNIGGILADDMGLGKTIETITLIMNDNSGCPNLIVCPKSVVFNWINEFRRFAPDEKVIEIYGLKKQRESIIRSIRQDEKVTYIVSYDSLRNDIDMYKTTFNHVVLDEAQYIKNVNAQKTNNVKKLKAAHRFALTGTPIENNIIDLWSVFDFIIPGYFEGIDEFKSKYNSDDNYAHIIAKRVAPFILRRNKKDVLKDLPEKYEHIITAEMTIPQRKVYDAYVMKAKEKMNEGLGAFDILPYLMRLRQICIDPKIFIENYEGDSGKMTMLKQIITDYLANNHRMLIVSQFVQALNEIEAMLKEMDVPYFMITGSVDAKKRLDICDRFNNDSKEKIVLVSLKAGGTGINLIGADTVIHLDPWWNVAATDQATDRTYRIGQKRNVEVIKLICDNSIEQRVIELQNIKKDLIEKVISDNDSSVTNASIEDIRFILT